MWILFQIESISQPIAYSFHYWYLWDEKPWVSGRKTLGFRLWNPWFYNAKPRLSDCKMKPFTKHLGFAYLCISCGTTFQGKYNTSKRVYNIIRCISVATPTLGTWLSKKAPNLHNRWTNITRSQTSSATTFTHHIKGIGL